MNILVIGAGYWGQKLIERFVNILGETHVGIYDKDESRRFGYHQDHFIGGTDPSAYDAVAIATPISSHYELAKAWLETGKHVFVEKPLAQTAEQARELGQLAEKKGLVLMTDLTFLHDKRIELLSHGSVRGMLWDGTPSQSSDEDIFWTWAPHPLSIALRVNGEPSHVGAAWLPELRGESRIYIILQYDGDRRCCEIILRWGDDRLKERTLLTGHSPDLHSHLDLTQKPALEPLQRICGIFAEAVEGKDQLRPRDPGVRVAELMSWLHEEFLASGKANTLEVKKWEPG